MRAGLIAAAATSGVLVAYGVGTGSVLSPFLFLGRYLGGFLDTWYPRSAVVLAGFLLHAAWIVAWCVAYFVIASGARTWIRVAAVVVFAALAGLISARLIGSALALSELGGVRWLLLYAVMALSLLVGTRLAL